MYNKEMNRPLSEEKEKEVFLSILSEKDDFLKFSSEETMYL
jgi:hypothetical protein